MTAEPPLDTFKTHEGGTAPSSPDRLARLGELRAIREAIRLPLRAPSLLGHRSQRSARVVVLPGYGTNDAMTLPLRRFLRVKGHRPSGWGLGVNRGDFHEVFERFSAALAEIVDGEDEPVDLVGWSLGGIYAREAARDRPDAVRSVVTFGSPLLGPRYSAGSDAFAEEKLTQIETDIVDRYPQPIDAAVTAMYSRNDGIVDWRTCIDRFNEGTRNVEITSTHVGMLVDPDVWAVVADRLSATTE